MKNIKKNRIQVTKEYYESDKLSLQRKMAIKSIKDKVDEQASKIIKNEMLITDSLQMARRQEKLLQQCSTLLGEVEAQGGQEAADASPSNIVRELQTLYDRYLKAYGNKKLTTQYQRNYVDSLIDDDDATKFEKKWTDLLDDVDSEMEQTDKFKILNRNQATVKNNYVGFGTTANAYRFYGRRRLNYRFL